MAAITVDPSRRLVRLLDQPMQEDHFKGSLSLHSVDTEVIFKAFVLEAMGEKYYRTIEKNRIFQQIAKNLRETHNFAALYKMAELVGDPQYDLVVLDTPPCHQVIEFFEAPQRLQKILQG